MHHQRRSMPKKNFANVLSPPGPAAMPRARLPSLLPMPTAERMRKQTADPTANYFASACLNHVCFDPRDKASRYT